MKRTPGKIKDFVEAQAFDQIGNYAADPARALAAYRFTEATAELLVRWLDALADAPRAAIADLAGARTSHDRSRSRALAGPRGAGKSHTLAVLSIVLAHPELRSTLADPQIAAAARRLGGRRFRVVRVERGTCPALEEEIAQALDRTPGAVSDLHNFHAAHDAPARDGEGRFARSLLAAASRSGDASLVFVIDTAYGRAERVARDDGAALVELARDARLAGASVLVALDDDIAGADGANAVLARDFQIDYLDPEHLLRVADLYVLRKTAAGRVALREIYGSLRETVPGFNWVETRFAALYPVHPIVADVAAAVRLYAPGFSLLAFAAEAAQRASGRPPHSLVTLDEVFDRAEYDLRRAAPLADLFAAYDDLAARAIAQLPIMERLRARLILKALFVLSLEGRGATAEEICTALLFEDEPGSDHARRAAEEALMMFAATSATSADAAPAAKTFSVVERAGEGAAWRYRFALDLAAGFEQRLASLLESAGFDDLTANRALSDAACRRFPDLPQGADGEGCAHDMFLLWRGTHRAGRFVVSLAEPRERDVRTGEPQAGEWRVVLLPVRAARGDEIPDPPDLRTASPDRAWRLDFEWRPALLRDDERAQLRRYAVLTGDAQLATEYAEQARVALAESAAELDRIWTRLYIEDGSLVACGADEGDPLDTSPADRLPPEAASAPTLARLLSACLDPHFARRYPAHPRFAEPFGEREAAQLAASLFGGADAHDPATQRHAALIALPLELVASRDDRLALKTNDELLTVDAVQAVLRRVGEADGGAVSLAAAADVLGAPPFGFGADACRLVLAALVANRKLEFTTRTGERLARRALAERLRWADVTGVVRASDVRTSDEELTAWARLFVEPADPSADAEASFERFKSLPSITNPATREEVRRKLAAWLDEWDERRTLARCESLPDSWLTLANADLARAVRRTLGVAAAAARAGVAGEIELEEASQRVADAFACSPATFAAARRSFCALEESVAAFETGEARRRYLLGVEPLPDPRLDELRLRLLRSTEDAPHLPGDAAAWNEFRDLYAALYVERHDADANCDEERRLIDKLLRGDEWRELEILAGLPAQGADRLRRLRRTVRAASHARCALAPEGVAELLREQPTCVCGFRLGAASPPAERARELEAEAQHELAACRRTLARLAAPLASALASYAAGSAADREIADRLARSFAADQVPAKLTAADVRVMRTALAEVAAPAPLRVELPVSSRELLTPAELDARVRRWLDELPADVHVVQISDSPAAARQA